MQSTNRVLLLLLTLVAMTGCAPVMVPVGEPSPPPAPTIEPAPDSESDLPIRQIEPSRSKPTAANSAVTQLLKEGWQLHRNGEYDRANAVAERALRLDRAESEIYLLLASNYYSMLQLSLAEQLARQGIPLASDDRLVQSRLRSLLDQILSAQ